MKTTMTKEVTFTLNAQEAVDIANIIGQVPTQAGVYPIYSKLKAQLEAQLGKEKQKPEDPIE